MTQGPEGKRATIYDVARRAEVSHQTVSRLIKGHSNISPELRVRIEAAIVELNYRPNVTARNLATRRPDLIAVLTADTSEYGPSQTLLGITEAARSAGFLVDVVGVNPADRAELAQAVTLFKSRDLAGIMAIAPADALVAALEGLSFEAPVHIWKEADDWLGGGDQTVNAFGQELLIDHLYGLGHRRFTYVSGPEDWISARHRSAGVLGALRRRGLKPVGHAVGDWSARSGYVAVARLPVRDFTALVAANDQMALGAMLALEDRGLSVPHDVSVVGFDDLPEAPYYRPPLTTVRQDFVQQGRIALSRLLSLIERSEAETPKPVTPVLVVRASSAPPRAT